MLPQSLHLFTNCLYILRKPSNVLSILRPASPLSQLAELAFFILQQLESLLLDQSPVWPAIVPGPIPISPLLGRLIRRIQLAFYLRELPSQPDLFPFLVLDRVAEIRPLGLVRASASDAQPAQVRVSEFPFPARRRLGVPIYPMSLRGSRVIKLVINLIVLKRRTQRRGDTARETEAFVSVIQDMQECQRSVFVNSRRRGRVNEVPCRADICIGDV